MSETLKFKLATVTYVARSYMTLHIPFNANFTCKLRVFTLLQPENSNQCKRDRATLWRHQLYILIENGRTAYCINFVAVISCPDIDPPVNGALAHHLVQLRPVYIMFCNANYTIPPSIEENGTIVNFNGQFTCTTLGKWVPIDYAPGCTRTPDFTIFCIHKPLIPMKYLLNHVWTFLMTVIIISVSGVVFLMLNHFGIRSAVAVLL